MSLKFLFLSSGFNSFLFSGMSKALSVRGVDSNRMHIFIINIPTFHARYRGYVFITNGFHKFC
jgi:hypothetical protein